MILGHILSANIKIVWTPTIFPLGMIFYDGDLYSEYNGHPVTRGLTRSELVIGRINGTETKEIKLFLLRHE